MDDLFLIFYILFFGVSVGRGRVRLIMGLFEIEGFCSFRDFLGIGLNFIMRIERVRFGFKIVCLIIISVEGSKIIGVLVESRNLDFVNYYVVNSKGIGLKLY